jgi:hypothetical protein
MTNFNFGKEYGDLKTFYSLQRADTVNVIHSKFVLRGAKDLVDENAGETLYSINRVGQLNMYQSSCIKLIRIVNYLGGLWSDEHSTTRYINRGNNGANNYETRGGIGTDYVYDENGVPAGKYASDNGAFNNDDGSIRQMLKNNNRVIHYRNAYMKYVYGMKAKTEDYNDGEAIPASGDYETLSSFNEICVANGKYLEIKKTDTEYGNVNGVFILSLLYSNAGEGGGFVYAAIGDADSDSTDDIDDGLNSGSTGAFVCITKDTTAKNDDGTNKNDADQPYMIISHNVGGYRASSDGESTGDYTYYYWFIKGNKYTYDMDVTGYIGTAENDFESSAMLTEEENRHYVLRSVFSTKTPKEDPTDQDVFDTDKLVDYWSSELNSSDKYALELRVRSVRDGVYTESSIGYLTYNKDNKIWGVKISKNNATKVLGGIGETDDSPDQDSLQLNDLIQIDSGVSDLEFVVVLHKGSAVLNEMRDATVSLDFGVYTYNTDGKKYDTTSDVSEIQMNIDTSIIRLVPTQDSYMSAGRIYAGVPTNVEANITGDSAFTVQYITKYMPSSFNTNSSKMTQTLTTSCDEIYLFDSETNIGFTLNKYGELINATEGLLSDYVITSTGGGEYQVTYTNIKDDDVKDDGENVKVTTLEAENTTFGATYFPAGTMITLVAQIDSYTPTYWYYYCTEGTSAIDLTKFVQMNTTDVMFSFEAASGGSVSDTSSQRITENYSFIVDFSQTDLSQYEADEVEKALSGNLRLLHTYASSNGKNIDIMDYVASQTIKDDSNNDTKTYTRKYPVVSQAFNVYKGTGALSLEASVDKESGFTKDTYNVSLDLEYDSSREVNTRYNEREYAILLECVGESGNAIPFPEGTTFTYNEKQLTAGKENKSVCIPVKNLGSYSVAIQTSLNGFTALSDDGKVRLRATAYSAVDASNYNELYTKRVAMTEFSVSANPTAALKVSASDDKNHLYSAGDDLELDVSTTSESSDDQSVSVKLYKLIALKRKYELIPLADIFDTSASGVVVGKTWNSKLLELVPKGTYRLEFKYYDKTEYWDFIVK